MDFKWRMTTKATRAHRAARKPSARGKTWYAVSSAMLAMAKSMALSAESVGTNAAAQTERNGILHFVRKIDQADEDAKEYMKLKRRYLNAATLEIGVSSD
jgi:hypothetical protein